MAACICIPVCVCMHAEGRNVLCLFPLQTFKYSSKSHPGGDHRHEKVRESNEGTPPCKMLRRSDSPDNKHTESSAHSRAKSTHLHRARDRDGGTIIKEHEHAHAYTLSCAHQTNLFVNN